MQNIAKHCKILQNFAKSCKGWAKVLYKQCLRHVNNRRRKTEIVFDDKVDFLAVLFPIEIRTLSRIISLKCADFLVLIGIAGLGSIVESKLSHVVEWML